MHQKSSQTPLGELTALPRPPSWIKGGLLLREGDMGRDGEERGGEGKGREGRGRDGKGGQPPIFYCTPQFQFSRNMPVS